MASDWESDSNYPPSSKPAERQELLPPENRGVPRYRPGAVAPYDQPPQHAPRTGSTPAAPEPSQPSAGLASRMIPPGPVAVGTEPRETLAELADDVDLLTSCNAESERLAREIAELRLLLAQTTHEAEQLHHRQVIAAASVREMEAHIEQFGRYELRARYLTSAEAEMRAFMMSEQRDQMRAKLATYERYAHFLRRLRDAAQTLHAQPTAAASMPAPSPFPRNAYSDPASAFDEFAYTSPGRSTSQVPERARTTAEMVGLPTLSGPFGPEKDTAVLAPGEADISAKQRPTTAEIVQLYRLIQSQEDVRQRIAQQLHDGPAQMLSNVVLATEVSEKLFMSDPPRALLELHEVRRQVTATLQATRKLIFDLRPMAIDDLGLVATIRRYAADLGAQYRQQIQVTAPEGEQQIAAEISVPVFRVAQEALKNAVQHARATFVRVIVSSNDANLALTVYDNGGGFDVQRILAAVPTARAGGLVNMRERALMLGGNLRIESVPGHGTQITLSIPLQTQRL